MRATSAASIAASEPAVPIAIPTVAAASAGASFTPSPIIATGAVLTLELADGGDLVLGLEARSYVVDPELAGDRLGCPGMVAAEHRHPADPQALEARGSPRGRWAGPGRGSRAGR